MRAGLLLHKHPRTRGPPKHPAPRQDTGQRRFSCPHPGAPVGPGSRPLAREPSEWQIRSSKRALGLPHQARRPACQASSVIQGRSPQLLIVPALPRQQPPDGPASPAPSATGRGRLSQRVRGSPDDAAPAPQTHCPGRKFSEIPGVLPAYFPSHPLTATRRLDSWLSPPSLTRMGRFSLTSAQPKKVGSHQRAVYQEIKARGRDREEGQEKTLAWKQDVDWAQVRAPVGGEPSPGRAKLGGLRSAGLGPGEGRSLRLPHVTSLGPTFLPHTAGAADPCPPPRPHPTRRPSAAPMQAPSPLAQGSAGAPQHSAGWERAVPGLAD